MAAGGIAGCLKVCAHIAHCLVVAKHNKKETASLGTAVDCIKTFLERLPKSVLSDEGVMVLGKLQVALQQALNLLQEVISTGPLMALVMATFVRDEFIRVNRDLMNTFQLLASGEQLLDLTQGRADAKEAEEAREALQAVERKLSRTRAVFFVAQEQVGGRLMDIAAAAHENGTPEQIEHQQLLDQLSKVPEITELSPEDLLAELQSLQLAAMYGSADEDTVSSCGAGSSAAGGLAGMRARSGKGKKLLGQDTEEFLVQQLCAALTPRAAQAGSALSPEHAAQPPEACMCPINQTVMVNPVMVVETGQTFEASAIRRWLSAHSTCPATNKRLSSKQLMPNYALKNIIDTWARDHGVRLVDPDQNRAAAVSTVRPHMIMEIPEAAMEAAVAAVADSSRRDDLHSSADQETGSQAAAAAVPHAAAAAAAARGSKADNSSDSSRQIIKDTGPIQDTVGSFKMPPFSDSKDQRKNPKRPLLQCTRTKWAVTLLVLAVLVAAGIGGGIAAVRLRKPKAASAPDTGSDPGTRVLDTPWGRWTYIGQNVTRDDAAKHCRSKYGGHLLTLDSKEKTQYLVDNLLFGLGQPVYIGLIGLPLPATAGKASEQREKASKWVWDSGVPLGSYTNWGRAEEGSTKEKISQPDGYGPEARVICATDVSCVSAAGSSTPAKGYTGQDVGSWDDHPCYRPRYFVCEGPTKG